MCNFIQLGHNGWDPQNDVSNCLGLFGTIHSELLWKKTPLGFVCLELAGVSTRSGMWTSGTWLPPPSYHPLPVLPSPQLALPVLRGRTANLLPLPHLVLESRAGPIHPRPGTGSGLKASLRCISQSPEKWSGVTVRQEGLSCRCPETSPGRAQTRSGLHQSQTLYTFPLQGLQKLLLLLAVWHGACWHTQPSSPSVASDRGNWQSFYLHLTALGTWFPMSTFLGAEVCFWNQVSSDGEGNIPLEPLGIIQYISHGHTFYGLETPYLLFLF